MRTPELSDKETCDGLSQLVAEHCGLHNIEFWPLVPKSSDPQVVYFAPSAAMPKDAAERVVAQLRDQGLIPILTRSVSNPNLYRPTIDSQQAKAFIAARRIATFQQAAQALLGIDDRQATRIAPFLNSKLGFQDMEGGGMAVATTALPSAVADSVVHAAKALGLRVSTARVNTHVVVCLAPAKPEVPAPQTAAGGVRQTESRLFF